MNLRQLSYFIAVAEHRSIVKAAQLLHISQPSVSTQIKLLEEELEVQLFERRPEGTILTLEGKEFLGYARSALDTLDAAKANLRSRQVTEVGTVAVGIPGSLSPLLTLLLIEQVRARCPNIKIKVETGLSGHLANWIIDGSIDFGLVYSSSAMVGLDIELLMTEQLFLAVHEENAGPVRDMCVDGNISFANLQHIPLVMPSREHGLRALVEKVSSSIGVRLDVRTELDAHELLLECVLRSTDATILSLAALRNSRIPESAIFAAHIIDPVIERRICVAYASDRPLTRTARRVEMILRELLKTESKGGWWRFTSINE
ncbi:LysR family transcriptional regulator [Alcaligenaceae bacterium CGII-47]|nr:LysR family transcriptional regulator [Alcaligenaceae bacterium CGII-47]